MRSQEDVLDLLITELVLDNKVSNILYRASEKLIKDEL